MRLASLLLLCVTFSAHALDTMEPFKTGLSDLELYYSRGEDNSQSYANVFGIGVNDYINPLVTSRFSSLTGDFGFGVTLENLTNIYKGAFDLDLIPRFSHAASENRLGLSLEATLPWGKFMPFLQTGGDIALNSDVREYLLTAGLMFAVVRHGELFAAVGHKWANEDVTVFREAVGFNYKIGESTELISEVSYEDQFGGMVGIIQSL